MRMDERLRVHTSKHHRQLYADLKGLVVKDSHELFFLSACVGYRNSCPTPLGKLADERFWSSTITPEEWCTYYEMILAENHIDFRQIEEDKSVIAKIEEYAHGGILYLIDNVLNGFLVEKEGEHTIDRTVAKDLPRRVMQYTFETASNG